MIRIIYLILTDENKEAYGDGLPQDEDSQGTDEFKQLGRHI